MAAIRALRDSPGDGLVCAKGFLHRTMGVWRGYLKAATEDACEVASEQRRAIGAIGGGCDQSERAPGPLGDVSDSLAAGGQYLEIPAAGSIKAQLACFEGACMRC